MMMFMINVDFLSFPLDDSPKGKKGKWNIALNILILSGCSGLIQLLFLYPKC